jgi:hypothetical protein
MKVALSKEFKRQDTHTHPLSQPLFWYDSCGGVQDSDNTDQFQNAEHSTFLNILPSTNILIYVSLFLNAPG